MAATLSFIESKKQFKWSGEFEDLKIFLLSEVKEDNSTLLSENDNGSCKVLKFESITFNYYVRTKTLQMQGVSKSVYENRFKEIISRFNPISVEDINEKEVEDDDIDDDEEDEEDNEDEDDDDDEEDEEDDDNEPCQNEVLTEIAKVWDAIKDIKQIISSNDNLKTAEQGELEQSKNRILQLEHENRNLLGVIRLMSSQNSYLPQFWQNPIVMPNERNERAKGNTSNANDNDDDNTTNDNGTNEQMKPTKKQKKKKSKQKNTNMTKAVNQNSSSPKVAQPETPKKSKPTVVIAGDSMVKYINGWKVCRNNSTTYVKAFSGATVNDMSHYIKPSV